MKEGKKMKKCLSLLVVCLLVLSGCSSKDKDNDDSIIVGMECNYAPFNWTQLDDSNGAVKISNTQGYCAGYDVEIAKLIAEELGKTLVIKKVTDFGSLPSEVNTNQIDLIIAGMSPTAERAEAIDFSNPYYYSDLVLVVRKNSTYASAKSLSDFSGAKVAAQINTLHDDVIDQINGVNHATALIDFPTLTVSVKSTDIDAFVSERPVALAIVGNNPDLTFVSFEDGKGFTLTEEDATGLSVSVGMKKNSDSLLESVNKVLNNLTDEDRDELMNKAIANQPESGE